MSSILRQAAAPRPSRVRRTPPRLEELEPRVTPSLMGNQLFPSDNPWNQKITNAPVAANSAALVSAIGLNAPLHADFGTTYAGALNGIPYNVVSGSQPKVNVVIDAYPDESDLLPVPIPADAVIEGDPLPSAQNHSDRHLIVYDQDDNVVYELFNAHRPSEESDGQWHADSEAVWNLNQDTFRTPGWTSADAAGLPILPGLVRSDEVLTQGVITHALRFTVPATDDAYVYPASHEVGADDPALPPMGERFRLKASFNIFAYPPDDQVILQALKDYGMIVADIGSPWYLSGAPSSSWSDSDLHLLGQLTGADFEAVDLTPIVTSLGPASGPTTGGAQVIVNGQDFSGAAGMLHVSFGGVDAGPVQVLSDTQLLVTAPAQATAGVVDVTVTSPYGTSATSTADRYTYVTGGPVFVLGADGSLTQYDPVGGVTLLSPAGTVLSISAAADGAGADDVFAVTSDRHLWEHTPAGWSLLSVGAFQQISAATNKSGGAVVFAVPTDNSLWEYSNLNPGGWALLSPAGTVLSIGAVTDASGNDDVYAVTADRHLWEHTPAGWALLSTGAFQQVSAGLNGAGQAIAYGVLADASLWEYNPAFSGGWAMLSPGGTVLAVAAGGADEVFAMTADHHLWDHRVAGWSLLSAGSFASIGATKNASGQGELFGVLADGSLWEYNPAFSGGPWQEVVATGVRAAAPPRR